MINHHHWFVHQGVCQFIIEEDFAAGKDQKLSPFFLFLMHLYFAIRRLVIFSQFFFPATARNLLQYFSCLFILLQSFLLDRVAQTKTRFFTLTVFTFLHKKNVYSVSRMALIHNIVVECLGLQKALKKAARRVLKFKTKICTKESYQHMKLKI